MIASGGLLAVSCTYAALHPTLMARAEKVAAQARARKNTMILMLG